MNITRLELTGFGAFRRPVDVDLSALTMAAVVGDNRAGKTTFIYDAVVFALYGKARGPFVTSVISRGAKTARVVLEFDCDQGHYRVTRTRSSSSGEVTLERRDGDTWKVDHESKHGQTDAAIAALVGTSYDVATYTWLIGQGESGAFGRLQPSERRAVLVKMFGLDHFADRAKKAKAAKQKATTDIATLDGRAQVFDAEMQRLAPAGDIAAMETRRDELSAELDEVNVARIASAGVDIKALEARFERAAAAHTEAQTHRTELDALTPRIEAGKTKLAERDEAVAEAREAEGAANARLSGLQAQRSGLDSSSSECFTCHSTLDAKRLATLLADNDTAQNAARVDIKDARARVKSENERRSKVSARLNELQRSASMLEKSLAAATSLASDLDDARSALDAARKAGNSDDLEVRERQIRAELDQLKVYLDREQANAQRREDITRERASITAERAELTTRQGNLDVLIAAFSPGGIPAMILAGIADEVNADANAYLDRVGLSSLRIDLSTQGVNAKGKATDQVTLSIVTSSGRDDYSTLSGSERFHVDIAIRLGLLHAVTARCGVNPGTIILDEGWGTLDAEGQRGVLDALAALSATYRVFTISHVDAVKAAFTQTVTVRDAGGTSVVTVKA